MPLQGVALSERGEAPAGRVSIGTMHLAKVVVTPFRGVAGPFDEIARGHWPIILSEGESDLDQELGSLFASESLHDS
jgi:hypothetical protein